MAGKLSRMRKKERKAAMRRGTSLAPVVPTTGGWRVSVMKDSEGDYPDLWMEVYISGPPIDRVGMAEFFMKSHCTKAESPETADLVVFTGGPDVNPALYGEDPHHTTKFDNVRDTEDIKLFQMCLDQGIPMLGVCRGAQLGHVLLGGKLYQHVDNHYGNHAMFDVRNLRMLKKISSVHHQMVIRNPDMQVLGDSSIATVRHKNPKEKVSGSVMDVEAFFYRDACFLGVQGHPEYSGYEEYSKWVAEALNEFILENPDITFDGRVRRLKPEFIEERELRASLVADDPETSKETIQ